MDRNPLPVGPVNGTLSHAWLKILLKPCCVPPAVCPPAWSGQDRPHAQPVHALRFGGSQNRKCFLLVLPSPLESSLQAEALGLTGQGRASSMQADFLLMTKSQTALIWILSAVSGVAERAFSAQCVQLRDSGGLEVLPCVFVPDGYLLPSA